MDIPSTATVRRPAPVEDYNEQRQKGRKITVEEDSSAMSSVLSMHVGAPCFLGDFLRSCGGPSSYTLERVGGSAAASSSSSTVGCFGFGFGTNRTAADRMSSPLTTTNNNQEDDPTALIAKAMTNLTIQEREQAYEDLHGVSACVCETPELIAKSLHEMEECLQKYPRKGAAYDLAMATRRDYVQDPEFRLLFLRSDRFDPALAAKRLCKFLKLKLRLFGEEKLCKSHIGLEDLDKDGRFMVESGIIQILPSRDIEDVQFMPLPRTIICGCIATRRVPYKCRFILPCVWPKMRPIREWE
jgi:hypothetical protein